MDLSTFLNTGGGGGTVSGMKLLDRQVFTAVGSSTWTKPADNAGNVAAGKGSFVYARAIGGGAGGPGGSTGNSRTHGGGGGGGEDFDTIAFALVGSTEAVIVGGGGAGGLGSSVDQINPGSAGGDSKFGNWVLGGGGRPDRSMVAGPTTNLWSPGGLGKRPGGSIYFLGNGGATIGGYTNQAAQGAGGGGRGADGTNQGGSFGQDSRCALGGAGGNANFGQPTNPGLPGGAGINYGPGAGGGSGSLSNGTPFTNAGDGGAGGLYGGGGGCGSCHSAPNSSGNTYKAGNGGSGGQGVVVVEVWGY